MHQRTEQEIMKSWKGYMDKPVVSVCCTTYNHEPYIAEAIEGFLIQETDFPFEILIRDDCSTDNTASIVKEYADKYPKLIKPIYEKENTFSKGVKPMPQLYKIAKGKYFALCEGDDYWTDPLKLQIQVSFLKKNKDYKLSFHLASELIDGEENIPLVLKDGKMFYSTQDIINCDFHFVQTNTMVFRRDALDNLDFDLLNNSPVGDVWIRIAASIPSGAIFINKVMGVYRVQSSGSWSESMNNDNLFLDYVEKMLASIDHFDAYWDFQYTKEFKSYKNKFIEVVLKKNTFDINKKSIFFRKYIESISPINRLKWHLIYKYPFFINYLRIFKTKLKFILK